MLPSISLKASTMEVLTELPAEEIVTEKENDGKSNSQMIKCHPQEPSISSAEESKYVEIYDYPGGTGESPQTLKLNLERNGSKVAFIRPKNGPCEISEINRLANKILADKSANQESLDYTSKMEGTLSPMGMKDDEVGERISGISSEGSENTLSPSISNVQLYTHGCPESSSSSCPSPIQNTRNFPKMDDLERGGKTSSSFGYDSDEDDEIDCKEICLSNERGRGRHASQLLQSQPSYTSENNNSNNDEAHYITTHEIQLSEVDHDMDFDYGLASRWDFEDNNVIYSFVDYASFGSEETLADTQTEEDNSCYLSTTTSDPNNQTDSIDNTSSTEIVSINSENDTPSTDKCASSEESQSKNLCNMSENSAGQILLSIKPTSRAINEPSNQHEKQNIIYAAKHEGDMSLCVSTAHERNSSFKQDVFHDYAKKFIAVPAHLQTRCAAIKARELGGYSSGASSVVSELDDADKEVRSLTARAFRSLAYPYFDTLNLSSSESSTSLSDHNLGINRWSTYLDLKCSSLGQKAEQNLFKSSAASAGWKRNSGTKTASDHFYIHSNKSQTKALEFVVSKLDGEITHVETPRCFEKQVQAGSRVVTLLETLDFSSNINAGVPRPGKPSENAAIGSSCTDEVTETLPKEQGNEICKQTGVVAETMEGTQKSKFASSLLKNVISKKMQQEHEFKMERGEITDTTYSGMSNSSSSKEVDSTAKEKLKNGGLQRQNSRYSEGSSDSTIVTADDLGEFFDSKSPTSKPSTPREANISLNRTFSETFLEEACKIKQSASETLKATFLRSQNSAFRTWKEKEAEKKEEKVPVGKLKTGFKGDWKADMGEITANKATKMSRLFVPNIQQTTNKDNTNLHVTKYSTATTATAQTAIATTVIKPKPPEIKISLGSVEQNKDNLFNITKLLSPKIAGNAPNFFKTAVDTRCQLQKQIKGEVMDKLPQFQVRDVRENKCKVQGPIHQVRDVRKLIKSSYSLESGDNHSDRGSVNSDQGTFDQKPKQLMSTGIPRSLSPMVITCQAVNNIKEDRKPNRSQEMGAKVSNGGKMLPSNQEGTILVHRTSGRLPVATIAPNKSDPRQPAVLKIVSKTSVPWRQQSHPPPQQPMTTEKSNKVEPLVVDGEELPKEEVTKASVSANHKALQKLTAAVRSMEELYSFSKNEWKRKSDPLPITDSHVLSLITREEQTIGAINTAREESMMVAKTEDQEATQTVGLTTSPSRSAPERQPRGRLTNPTKNTEKVSAKTAAFENLTRERARVSGFHGESASRNTGSAEKERVPVVPRTTVTFNAQGQKAKHQPPVLSSPSPPRGLKGQARPRAMKLFGNRQGSLVEPDKSRKPTFPDCGNYLAISLKESSAEQPAPVALGTGEGAGGGSRAGPVATASPAATQPLNLGRSVASFNPIQAPQQQQQQQPTATTTQPLAQRQPPLPPQPQLQAAAAAPPLEMSPAHIFPQALSLAAAAAALTGAAQPATPLLCFSPPTSAEPAAFPPQTQRKVLLDLSTGQCYFVDTPLQPQPQKRRLFDPETGQYVEVPLLAPPPQPPALAPMTIPMSSLALGAAAGTYSAPAAAYMFYPGFLPAVLSATALQGQLAQQPSGELGSAAASSRSAASPATESPYYMPTGTQQQQQPCPQAASSDGKAPLISITSQPLGPRIIAPPSFDGTTMRFVVEHR